MNFKWTKLSILLAVLILPASLALAFTDVSSSNQHNEAIQYLQQKGIIQGYTDGTFRPNSPINRAEFLKILLEAKSPGIAVAQNLANCFPDVAAAWYSPYICYAKTNGIVSGYPDGNFKPQNNINLAEALKMVLETYDIEMKFFTTADTKWYEPYYLTAELNGWLSNINHDVAHLVTRGEMAQLIFAIEDPSIAQEPGPSSTVPITDDDLNLCPTGDCDFLIFVSPQYANDQEIRKSAQNYILAVKARLGWNTRVMRLTGEENQIRWIDEVIEATYASHPLLAALMIGEDIKTPVIYDGDDGTNGQEQPMPAPWSDVDENLTAYSCPSMECARDYTSDVAISFLYPTASLEYEIKKEKIIFALNKFAEQKTNYDENIQILMSKEMSVGPGNYGIGFSGGYGKLYLSGNLDFLVNPSQGKIVESLAKRWKIFGVEGHANSLRTVINDEALWPNSEKTRTEDFTVENLKTLNTALYMSNGCLTGGWVPNLALGTTGNGILDPANEENWWGNYIFENPYLRTELNSGLGSDFTHCAADLINKGLTMAEIFSACNTNVQGIVMFGDPTLRFNPYTPPSVPSLEVWGQDVLDLPRTPHVGETSTIQFSIRNTGPIGTTTRIHVYDASNFDDLFLTPSIYNDPTLLIDHPELKICQYDSDLLADSKQNFECEWTATKTGINTIVIRAENNGMQELNEWDNWQRTLYYVSP